MNVIQKYLLINQDDAIGFFLIFFSGIVYMIYLRRAQKELEESHREFLTRHLLPDAL